MVIDVDRYGRLLRAARIYAGYDRVDDAATAIVDSTSVPISTRTLYALERGEQMPSIEQFLACAVTYDPIGGWAYWAACYTERVREYERKARREAMSSDDTR